MIGGTAVVMWLGPKYPRWRLEVEQPSNAQVHRRGTGGRFEPRRARTRRPLDRS